MEYVGWLAAAVTAAFLTVTLRRRLPEQALAVSLIGGVVLTAAAVTAALPIVRTIRSLAEQSAVSEAYFTVLLKGFGICLLTQLASDACRDAGEQGMAGRAETVGKLALIALALPMISDIAELALQWIRG